MVLFSFASIPEMYWYGQQRNIFPVSTLLRFWFPICLGATKCECALVPCNQCNFQVDEELSCDSSLQTRDRSTSEATERFQSRFPKVSFFCSCCSHTSTLVRKVPSCGVCSCIFCATCFLLQQFTIVGTTKQRLST
jgi:hypothetical protein